MLTRFDHLLEFFMNIYLCYAYMPNTTALYFERALQQEHKVYYVGPSSNGRLGYDSTIDVNDLINWGLPSPDLFLLIEPALGFFPRGLERVNCPTAIYLIDVHRHLGFRMRYAPFFDYIFVAQRDYVQKFRDAGFQQTSWLPLACDPELHGHRDLNKQWDVGFVGNINSSTRSRRLKLLSQFFTINDYLKPYPKEKIGEIYSQSRIVINSSIDNDLNMRVFEAMASGSLLLTDKIGNGQSALFENQVHFLEYKDDEEMIQLARYYLDHPEESHSIASTGMQLVHSKHTYLHRCHEMINTIFGHGKPNFAAHIRQLDQLHLHLAYAKFYSGMNFIDALLDELERAWKHRRGYIYIWGYIFFALTKKLYRISKLPKSTA